MSVQPYERYIPLVKINRVATAAEVTANEFTIVLPYVCTGAIVNHRQTDGTTYATAQKVTFDTDGTTGVCTMTVEGTAVTAGDTIHVLAWA